MRFRNRLLYLACILIAAALAVGSSSPVGKAPGGAGPEKG